MGFCLTLNVMRALLLLGLVVSGCTKPVSPGALADFQPPIGGSKFAACSDANDGKRFSLRGFFVLGGDVRVSDGEVSLWLYERYAEGEGGGARATMELKDGKHVTFDVKDVKWKTAGYRREEGKGALEGVTFHTTSGEAKLGEEVAAVVELHTMRLFQQKELAGCRLELIELRK